MVVNICDGGWHWGAPLGSYDSWQGSRIGWAGEKYDMAIVKFGKFKSSMHDRGDNQK